MRRVWHDRGLARRRCGLAGALGGSWHPRRWVTAVGSLGLWGLLADPAAAHPQFALSTVNRYGKLVLVSPRQARVFFTLMVGDTPALAMRQQADRNRDGTLDDGEQQALATLLRARVASGVHVYRGEAEVPLPWDPPALKLDNPAVAAAAFAYELTATLPLVGSSPSAPGSAVPSPAVDELRYDDRVELPPIGELELLVEAGPDMQVLQVQSSLLAPPPAGGSAPPQLLVQWSGPPRSSLSDRSIRVRFTAAAPVSLAARRRPSLFPIRWPWFLGALASVIALIAGFRIRRVGRPD